MDRKDNLQNFTYLYKTKLIFQLVKSLIEAIPNDNN
jgi:hypothetical protein